VFSVLLLSIPAPAEEPPKVSREIKAVRPLAAPVGGTAVLTIAGQELAPREVRFDDPRVTARLVKTEPFTPKGDAEKGWGNIAVTVEVAAPPDLAPGFYPFKLLQESGEPLTGQIYLDTPCPQVAEAEPNDSLRKPQALPPAPVAVLGTLDGEGVDVFRFEGKAGEIWRFEVLARRAGSSLDAVLRLRDPRLVPIRAAVSRGDDCVLEVTLPMDGAYLIEVFDAENSANPGHVYRLRVERRR
jgi:hypothetical protein